MTQPHPAGPPTRRARLVATAIRLVTFASIALLVWNVDILQRHALARWAGAALGVLALASVIRAFARDRRAGREGPGSPWWIAAYGVSALALVLNGPDVLDRLPKWVTWALGLAYPLLLWRGYRLELSAKLRQEGRTRAAFRESLP